MSGFPPSPKSRALGLSFDFLGFSVGLGLVTLDIGLGLVNNIRFSDSYFIYLELTVMRCQKESRIERGDCSVGEIVTTRYRATLVRMYEVMSRIQVQVEKVVSQEAREYREAGES